MSTRSQNDSKHSEADMKKAERFPVLRPYLVSVGLAIAALVGLGAFIYYRDPTCANTVFASLNSWCHWPK